MSVVSVALSQEHKFSKTSLSSITLLPGLGVKGDCHCGVTDQHSSRLHIKPPPYNLRQVHLIHAELFEEVSRSSDGTKFSVQPGQLGENITTAGIDLLELSTGTKLHFVGDLQAGLDVEHPVVMITGLRNPCSQIDRFQKGLKEKCLLRDSERKITGRKAGVMSIVKVGGEVKNGAIIIVEKPERFKALECV
ncbi:hypothetical protein PVAG01_02209 [Phlyctema vagabunda]|uniref:MOSC domain-containing protein n=1 Tax=Phlyctema vagabunda TaxID=108571 RepID=A0ABR4PPX7_9HELO